MIQPSLRRLVPPAAIDLRRRLRRTEEFPTFTAAQAACPEGYSSRILARTVVEKTAREVRRGLRLSADDPAVARVAIALSARTHADQVRVVDFGGGAGMHYHIARRLLPADVQLDWTVVETEAMVEAAGEQTTDELRFVSQLNDTMGAPDILLAVSSLQYLADPMAALDGLLACRPDSVLLARTPMSTDGRTRFAVQRSTLRENGPGGLPDGVPDAPVGYPITYVPVQAVRARLQDRFPTVLELEEERGSFQIGRRPVSMFAFAAR